MKKVMLALLFSVMLTGCSSMASALLANSAPRLDTELVVGQKTQEMSNQVGDQAQYITKIQQIPWFFVVLLVLGWFMPSPHELGRGIYILCRGRDNESKRC